MTSLKRIKKGWMNLRVAEVITETHDTKTFVFVDADEGTRAFDFIAGQYLTFRYDTIQEKPVVRSYTMSGSPCQNEAVYVTVKRIPGGLVSNWMCDTLKCGDILRARGPIGKFVYEPDVDKPHLFMIAAGSGVTPFTSILREYKDRLGTPGAPSSLHLLVAYRSRDDLINWSTLSQMMHQRGINIRVTLTREKSESFWFGRPDDKMITEFVGDLYASATFMTCGPKALMDYTSEHLTKAGVPEICIKTEAFD